MMDDKLLEIINFILERKGKKKLNRLRGRLSLRKDLEMDSLDLAELTVRIEDAFGVDIFEDGLVDSLVDVWKKMEGRKK